MRKRKIWLALLLGAAALTVAGCQKNEKTPSPDAVQNEENLPQVMEIKDTSSLRLSSVYASSILNPDCGDEFAEDVASIEVNNDSEHYLESAELEAVLSDGSKVQFLVSDLPAGGTAEVFGTGNEALEADVTCESVACVSEKYIKKDVLMSEELEISQNDLSAVITNRSDKTLENLKVVYHCDIGGQYFGGIAYEHVIEGLASGESYEITDENLMGAPAIVRVYQ